MIKVRVATLNTCKGEGAYSTRLDLMSRGLRAIAPDILLLQEALATPDHRYDTARQLAMALGLRHQFHPARRKLRDIEGTAADCYSGLAVLARHPVRAREALRLSQDPRDGDRHCQLVTVDLAGHRLLVANTHLTHLPDHDELRKTQLREIVEGMRRRAAGTPAILGGDLNATSTSPPLQWLATQRFLPLISAWQEASDGECVTTMNRGEPPVCIDHLYRSATGSMQTRWINSSVGLEAASDREPVASDHLAVCAHLQIDTRQSDKPVAAG
jgi:endonuclease/exonuclease/phosphatase family metal-dependent hydrolase